MRPNPIFSELGEGQRLVRGRPHVFDLDAANDWRAIEAKLDAPAELTRLTESALRGLVFSAVRLAAMSGNRDTELGIRAEAELRRRDQRRAA